MKFSKQTKNNCFIILLIILACVLIYVVVRPKIREGSVFLIQLAGSLGYGDDGCLVPFFTDDNGGYVENPLTKYGNNINDPPYFVFTKYRNGRPCKFTNLMNLSRYDDLYTRLENLIDPIIDGILNTYRVPMLNGVEINYDLLLYRTFKQIIYNDEIEKIITNYSKKYVKTKHPDNHEWIVSKYIGYKSLEKLRTGLLKFNQDNSEELVVSAKKNSNPKKRTKTIGKKKKKKKKK